MICEVMTLRIYTILNNVTRKSFVQTLANNTHIAFGRFKNSVCDGMESGTIDG
jgi:hypothetical protein